MAHRAGRLSHFHHDRDERADCVEWFARRATQRHARELTMLRSRSPSSRRISLEASFTSEGRVTGLFGASAPARRR